MQNKEEFLQLIHNLETDVYFAVTVTDMNTGEKIISNAGHADIIGKYGTLENFFNPLLEEPGSEIGVRTRRKNGSGWKFGKEPFMRFSNNKQSDNDHPYTDTEYKQKQTKEKASKKARFGLGLNAPDVQILELYADAKDRNRLEARNAILEKEINILNNQLLELKTEKLEWSNKKASSESTAEIIKSALPHLEGILSTVMSKGAAPMQVAPISPGLGNPAYSPDKNELVSAIHTCNEATVGGMLAVYDRLNDLEFVNELNQLFEKYPLH